MDEFPKELDEALKHLSKELGFGVAKNTHYDAVNRETGWFTRNKRTRINFEYDGRRIEVFLLIDTFPFSPRFLIWCHNHIPMCKLFAKIQWQKLGELPPDQTQEFYWKRIRGFIQNAEGRQESAIENS